VKVYTKLTGLFLKCKLALQQDAPLDDNYCTKNCHGKSGKSKERKKPLIWEEDGWSQDAVDLMHTNVYF